MYRKKLWNGSRLLCTGLVAASFALAAQAETLLVPSAYPTIQAAIDAAVDGDEIIVAAGTYNEAINLRGKAVYLQSSDGPETTIIDAAGLDTSAVTCVSGEGPDTVIEDFTIARGSGTLQDDYSRGGGMYNVNSSVTVMGCIFRDNAASYGGGLYNEGGSPTLTHCTIRNNVVSCIGAGGGLCIEGGSLILTNCTISENLGSSCNTMGTRGNGMYIHNASAMLTNCTLHGNSGLGFYSSGGGIFSSSSSLTLENCTFRENVAGDTGYGGGGVLNIDSSPTLTNCTFIGNYLDGMANYGSDPTLINCTFADHYYGGDMLMYNSSPSATNCTFIGWVGGDDAGTPTFTNCILSGWWGGNMGNVTYSNVRGGHPGIGNIDADPLFVDLANGDLRLGVGSPCIDAGSNWTLASGGDADGNCRVMDGDDLGAAAVDMGSFEAAGAILDCNGDGICDTQQAAKHDCNHNLISDECDFSNGTSQDCNGNGIPDECDCANGFSVDCNQNASPDECDIADGTSQDVIPDGGDGIPDNCQRVHNVTQDARYRWIQEALDLAADGDEIMVSADTYHEVINFEGKAVYLHSAEGPDATIIDATGLHTSAVTCANGETANTIFEGFTITGGIRGMHNVSSSPTVSNCTFRDSRAGYRDGAGMLNYSSSPTVTDCTFSGNNGATNGGGMCNSSNSNPRVTSCTFTANHCYGYGGGMYNSDSSPTVADCTFSGNSARLGGGMQNEGNPTVTDCTFTGNHGLYGGGMLSRYCLPTVTNCTFDGNSANDGGAMVVQGSSAAVTNCTFRGNVAAGVGGAISTYYSGAPRITNCTFSGNQAYWGGGAIFSGYNNSATVINCVLWGDGPDEISEDRTTVFVHYSDIQGGYTGTGNIDVDPLFVRAPSPGDDGEWGTDDDDLGDLRLTAFSPCIDAGAPWIIPCQHDLAGACRVWDGNADNVARVDMGAYEFSAPRGDLDGDCEIGPSDLAALLANFGGPGGAADGDLTGDGGVDLADLSILLSDFGSTCP